MRCGVADVDARGGNHEDLFSVSQLQLDSVSPCMPGIFFSFSDDCLRRMARDYLAELKSLITLNFQLFPFHKTS